MKTLSEEQALEIVRQKFTELEITQSMLASELGVSRAYVNAMLLGKTALGEKILNKFGLHRCIISANDL